MKRKSLARTLALLCLISVLAACSREAAPAPAPPQTADTAPEAAASPAPVTAETYAECDRRISNWLEQNKSRLPLSEVLSLDKAVFFAGYDGSPAQTVEYEPVPELLGEPENDTSMTGDVYYWRDDSGTATPERAAAELVTVMLEHLKSLPEDRRTFTITDYSVKDQTVYAWEDLPGEIMSWRSFDYNGLSHDEAVMEVRKQLWSWYSQPTPFAEFEYIFALGEDMWALDPYFTFDYEGLINMYRREEMEAAGLIAPDGLCLEYQQGSPSIFDHILMRDGNVWRMQRAGALEEMFRETVWIERMGGYTLSQLEHSMIEGGREYYIEGAAGEYLRRLRLDPEGMYAHMDELGFPRLAWLCDHMSYEANNEGLTPEGDSVSAELLGKYMAFHSRETAHDERPLPPAAGVLCPALCYDGIRVRADSKPQLNYADDSLLVFSDWSGVYAYDFGKEEIVFTADLLTAMGCELTQGRRFVRPLVDDGGGRIRLAYREEDWDHWLVRYEIDTSDWSWEFVEYELPNTEADKLSTCDPNDPGQGRIELKTLTGTNSTQLLSDLTFIRGGEELRVFDGFDFSGRGGTVPVPSKDLERSVHNALLCRYDLPGDFQCEAHETLGARPDGAGNTVCWIAFQCEAFSLANGAPLSTSCVRSCAALTFRTDESGRCVLTDFDGPDKGPWGGEIARIFPEDLRGSVGDAEMEEALARSCISQAMEHFGLVSGADENSSRKAYR